jgi:hypothetical protein
MQGWVSWRCSHLQNYSQNQHLTTSNIERSVVLSNALYIWKEAVVIIDYGCDCVMNQMFSKIDSRSVLNL